MFHTNELETLGLEGRIIYHIFVDDGESILALITDVGPILWQTWGDCCSTTWFADLRDIHRLLGFQVLAATQFDPPEVDDGRTRQQFDQFYGIRLRTERGLSEIIYRNSSNGYYGGSLELMPFDSGHKYFTEKQEEFREVLYSGPLDSRMTYQKVM